jgi:hypothetical protein
MAMAMVVLQRREVKNSMTIWLTVLWIRIRMFLALLNPDPSLFCTEPDPSIKKQKVRKTLKSPIL